MILDVMSIKNETEDAYLVEHEMDGAVRTSWIPKSQIGGWDRFGSSGTDDMIITDWLARQKGWIGGSESERGDESVDRAHRSDRSKDRNSNHSDASNERPMGWGGDPSLYDCDCPACSGDDRNGIPG